MVGNTANIAATDPVFTTPSTPDPTASQEDEDLLTAQVQRDLRVLRGNFPAEDVRALIVEISRPQIDFQLRFNIQIVLKLGRLIGLESLNHLHWTTSYHIHNVAKLAA